MRITGGQFLNRPLSAPPGDRIRPASDRVRAAVFSILNAHCPEVLDGTAVLDLCCGVGSYGLEALSRGAASCTFVDNSPESLAFARQNAERLGVAKQCRFIRAEAQAYLPLAPLPQLVFLDPPYATSLLNDTLAHLSGHLADGTVLVCESGRDGKTGTLSHFEKISQKFYGQTQIVVLRYIK